MKLTQSMHHANLYNSLQLFHFTCWGEHMVTVYMHEYYIHLKQVPTTRDID